MCSSRAASKRAGVQVPCELIDACSPDDAQDPANSQMFDWIANQAAKRRLLGGIQVDEANDIQVDDVNHAPSTYVDDIRVVGTNNAQGDGTNELPLQTELGGSLLIGHCRATDQWHLSRLAGLMATSCLFQLISHRVK